MRSKAADAASKVADAAQQAGSQAKEAAASLASEAQERARGLLNMQVTAGADLASHVARSARSAADELDEEAPQLAGLVRGAADRVEEFSHDLREQTVEDLVRTASDFTRRQPALVFGLASLAGFLAFRVLKSTPTRRLGSGSYASSGGSYPSSGGGSYPSSGGFSRSGQEYRRPSYGGGAPAGQFHGT
jgi:ElaB/YqjD/DUF883 family membrane-anchored ribosome-binding protein